MSLKQPSGCDPQTSADCKPEKIKKDFIAPEIISESLLAFGAVCNGTTTGRRKDTTAAPASCNSSRLFS